MFTSGRLGRPNVCLVAHVDLVLANSCRHNTTGEQYQVAAVCRLTRSGGAERQHSLTQSKHRFSFHFFLVCLGVWNLPSLLSPLFSAISSLLCYLLSSLLSPLQHCLSNTAAFAPRSSSTRYACFLFRSCTPRQRPLTKGSPLLEKLYFSILPTVYATTWRRGELLPLLSVFPL